MIIPLPLAFGGLSGFGDAILPTGDMLPLWSLLFPLKLLLPSLPVVLALTEVEVDAEFLPTGIAVVVDVTPSTGMAVVVVDVTPSTGMAVVVVVLGTIQGSE